MQTHIFMCVYIYIHGLPEIWETGRAVDVETFHSQVLLLQHFCSSGRRVDLAQVHHILRPEQLPISVFKVHLTYPRP